jgi:sugar lactone lactonase YvrE
LWVGERENNRVLRFDNAAAKANGAAADGVLGQPDFVTKTSGVTASIMSAPFGVYLDAAGRLWVAEDGNCRVLRFDDAAAKANGGAADGVLGQPNFTSNTYATTQTTMGNIRGVWGDIMGRIYLVDEGNSRIVVYNNAASLANGAKADNVIGQADFVNGNAMTPPTAATLAYPNSMYIDNAKNHIWVADAANNRVVRFDVQLGNLTGVRGAAPGQVPTQIALSQNFPNPFNPSTTISFVLAKSERATVTVYNVLGQPVATLFEGTAAANEQYMLTFNAANLPSGLYVCILRSGTLVESKKMVLMK